MGLWRRTQPGPPATNSISTHPSHPPQHDSASGEKSPFPPSAAAHIEETTAAISTGRSSSPTPDKWDVSKPGHGHGDVAMALFDSADQMHEPLDPDEERRVVRKIDFMILPYLAVCYAFFYIDKTTLSYAAIFVSFCPSNLPYLFKSPTEMHFSFFVFYTKQIKIEY